MTDPAITAALEKLIADTPPPVTVWGVRFPSGYIDWFDIETEARDWLADVEGNAELVHITGRLHMEG